MPTATNNGPASAYRALLGSLRDKAANAARRNKPTMWAYYLDMVDGLRSWFDGIDNDGAVAGAALALSQRAENECPSLGHMDAARLWALGVYARRILGAWGAGAGPRVSLAWLRERSARDEAERDEKGGEGG